MEPMRTQFSLKQVLGFVTLFGVLMATAIGLSSELLFSITGAILLGVFFAVFGLAVWGASDPWLGFPSGRLDAPVVDAAAGIRSGRLAFWLTIPLVGLASLTGSLIFMISLIVWTPSTFELILGLCLVLGCAAHCVSLAGLIALFLGSPLGRRYAIAFCTSLASLAWLTVTLALASMPFNTTPATLNILLQIVFILGYVLFAVGFGVGCLWQDKIAGFARASRRWAARGMLLAAPPGVIVIWFLMSQDRLAWGDPIHWLSGPTFGGGLGSLIGALGGARSERKKWLPGSQTRVAQPTPCRE